MPGRLLDYIAGGGIGYSRGIRLAAPAVRPGTLPPQGADIGQQGVVIPRYDMARGPRFDPV